MKIIELTGTTDGAEALTITSSRRVNGFIEKIVNVFDDGAATADVVVTCEDLVSEPILTVTNMAAADITYYPRTPGSKVADATAFTNWADKIFVTGAFKIVIAQGGATKNFKFAIYVSDE